MMDQHSVSKCKSSRVSTSKVAGTISATEAAASYTHNEKLSAEREATALKVAGPATGIAGCNDGQIYVTSSPFLLAKVDY